jgi:SIR2-like domain
MKRKLLIVLGAGSSLNQHMPSVDMIGDQMKIWSDDWFRSDIAIPPVDNYFLEAWTNANFYFQQPFLSYRVHPNFERVLGDMISLAHWMAPAPMGNPLRRMISGDQVPLGLKWKYDSAAEPFGAFVMINSQLGYLLKRLVQYVRDCCRSFDAQSASFVPYRRLLGELRDAFDVGIYNLNYDNVALTASPEAFAGFAKDGLLDACAIHQRSPWNFIYHLHGSVHHTLTDASAGAIRWQDNIHASFKDGDEGQAINKVSDDKSFPRTTLIAGGFKLDQLLIEPFHTLYASLNRHLHQADAILIGGYGFGDTHVNRALRSRLEYSVVRNPSRRPPIMILEKSKDGEWQMDTRQDNWSRNMKDTLLANGFQCEQLDPSDARAPQNLISSRSFEFTPIHKVAVWHGGFCEAVGQFDRIAQFLLGGDPRIAFRGG